MPTQGLAGPGTVVVVPLWESLLLEASRPPSCFCLEHSARRVDPACALVGTALRTPAPGDAPARTTRTSALGRRDTRRIRGKRQAG